ncbi:hypothetical protein DUNSADRAFT_13286 [Dunaliella salina]|uniref:Encoded protein n=1 Tax=Dunaliella salina TaxID=3046 RepID=A0ABQ7G9R7_DUNSA|nr:hypothetical protein DUNSADRAFT_13286 [Dunaliella salina]|eukprot:KAF5831347.1 hypothetical protein DUNSADRAFT_13286 [Dunaliella salina]
MFLLLQGYTVRQSDTGNDPASISTLERLCGLPQFANLQEEWEAAKEDGDLSTESGDWVELSNRTNNKDQDAAENVDEDGVVVQALPPARAAIGCGLGAGPGAQFDNFCNPEEEGHGGSLAKGGDNGRSQPYVPTLLQAGSRSRRRILPLLSKSPSTSPPSKQQSASPEVAAVPQASMLADAAAAVHVKAGSVLIKQQPEASMLPKAAAAHAKAGSVLVKQQSAADASPEAAARAPAAAVAHAEAGSVRTSAAPPSQAAQSVSTLQDEIKHMRLMSEVKGEAAAANPANPVSPSTAAAPTDSDRLLQQGKDGKAAAGSCSPPAQGEGSQEALDRSMPEPGREHPQETSDCSMPEPDREHPQETSDCSMPEPEGQHQQAPWKQLPGGIVCTLPGACNVGAAQPLLEHELEQDDQEMLQNLGLSPSAAVSSKLKDGSTDMQETSPSDQNRSLPATADLGSSTSQVEAFSLDKDFDYDNCKFTPREWPYNRFRHGAAPFSQQKA